MICPNDNAVVYKKKDPSEIIEVGDIIMLDPESATITRAVVTGPEDFLINSRLIIGVCTASNNNAPVPIIIDGGRAKTTEFELLDGGTDETVETIIISGGTDEQNAREIIQVAYKGEHMVNICGYVSLGDKLCISEHAGKAKSKDYIDFEYFTTRSIGKVISFTNSKEQVKVLLDIE